MEQNSDINHDELTIKQQKEIEKEVSSAKNSLKNWENDFFRENFQINEQFALISEKIPLETLNDEYADDQIYRKKVQDIAAKYRYVKCAKTA